MATTTSSNHSESPSPLSVGPAAVSVAHSKVQRGEGLFQDTMRGRMMCGGEGVVDNFIDVQRVGR